MSGLWNALIRLVATLLASLHFSFFSLLLLRSGLGGQGRSRGRLVTVAIHLIVAVVSFVSTCTYSHMQELSTVLSLLYT